RIPRNPRRAEHLRPGLDVLAQLSAAGDRPHRPGERERNRRNLRRRANDRAADEAAVGRRRALNAGYLLACGLRALGLRVPGRLRPSLRWPALGPTRRPARVTPSVRLARPHRLDADHAPASRLEPAALAWTAGPRVDGLVVRARRARSLRLLLAPLPS